MPKNVVVCCDGTWNTSDQRFTTNVVRFYEALAQSDEQVAFYHRGVGTTPWLRFLGGAFGVGLSAAVRDCYRFVVDSYEPGDRIYLLGFSRGAYTARSISGLLRNAGILRRENVDRLDEAYALYRSKEGPDAPSAQRFREQYCLPGPVPIEFIGVWDTVGALGVPDFGLPLVRLFNRAWQFHDVQLSSRVRHAYHALALDEKRKPFVPTLWQPQPAVADQVVEQVWFTGVHSDVGGGYDERDLASITLHWMAQRAVAAGVALDAQFPLLPDAYAGVLHDSLDGIYTVLGPAVRTPGAADAGHEFLSSTAAARLRQNPEYGTAPARAYLDANRPQQVVG